MKFKEIKKLSQTDLQKKLNESRVKLRELNFSVANNQFKNIRDIRKLKKLIAQILTILNSDSKNSGPAKQSEVKVQQVKTKGTLKTEVKVK